MAEFSKAIARLMEERPADTVDPPALRGVLERIRGLVTPIERPLAEAFARQLFSRSGSEHLVAGDLQTWAIIAVNAFRFISEPGPLTPRVRVFNPEASRDAWESPDTVVETSMQDCPFIVDTIRECAQAHVGPFHRLLHPVIAAERDAGGALVSVGVPGVVGRNESFVHAEIARVSDPGELQATIAARLADVEAATQDYQPMRSRAIAHAERLRETALPRPWNEDVDEVAAFLEWLTQKSFVFLGYREYDFTGQGTERRAAVRAGSGLGILRDTRRSSYARPRVIPDALRRRINEPPLLIVSKTNAESPIHRRARMDYVGLKRVDPSGVVVGECRFLGLFTSKAYAEVPADVPLLRRKLQDVLGQEEAVAESHDYKAIVELFQTIPKEELFGSSVYDLAAEIATVRAAEGTEGIRVVYRPDALARGAFVVVVLARNRFSGELHRRIEQRLLDALNGALLDQHVALDDLERVRLHFYIGLPYDQPPRALTATQLEAEISDLLRTWDDRLTDQLLSEMPAPLARQLAAKYLPAFSPAYRAATDVPVAVRDIRCLEALAHTRAPQVDVSNALAGAAARFTALKLYLLDEELVLSDFLPLLENIGLKVLGDDHLDVPLAGVGTARIHTFFVQDGAGNRLDVEQTGQRIASTLLALRAEQVDNDPLNRLVLSAGLQWREVDALRAYVSHLQQAQVAARELLVAALAEHPEPTRQVFEAFRVKFDPSLDAPQPRRETELLPEIETRFLASLDAVEGVSDDRILRAAWATLAATVRTNFYAPAPAPGAPPRPGQGTIALKIESGRLPHLPQPRPLCEVLVHGPQVTGIHLRGGKVARGGIRLSDRSDDFRTEVLGLMKTQMVKNAVIVPVGSKGGFVVKRRAGGGQQLAAVAAYRAFIGGLLDVTDNIVQGGAVPPPGVLIYDESDPYLVVAADKGTATFSDIANEIAASYGFWLGDAFASGGSHGYDHKKEGITARGAWESVRQHCRALGRDADGEPLTVIGIGDMSGDVFGNGLLRSPHLRLLAAFNHRHLFLDPDPDPTVAFAERQRLFALPRSGWEDYDTARISAGGGVFLRAAKKVPLSPEVRGLLGVEVGSMPGEQLVRAILGIEADLLWNGGIGTYVKARDETNAEVGDAANDVVRIDADQLRVKIVAEGGNLGFTQRARVEFAVAGGHINTDAIDNSAGVDLSDHEVNLKIALGRAIEANELTVEARNELLAELTGEVCDQVLADNRRQARALTLDQIRSRTRLGDFRDLIGLLESEAHLDRQLERLPDRATLRARRGAYLGLTRPELAVVMAYSKLHLQDTVLQSALPDDPFLERFLRRYFPEVIDRRYGDAVRSHRLRREITAVVLANWLIDAMGVTFVPRIARDTGRSFIEVVKAWTAVVTISGADRLIDRLLAGTPPLAGEADAEASFALERYVERATKWMLETQSPAVETGDLVQAFVGPVAALQHRIGDLLTDAERQRDQAELAALTAAGAPSEELAKPLVALRRTAELFEIDLIATEIEASLEAAAEVYYRVGALIDLDWIAQSLATVAGDDRWERRAAEGLSEGLIYARRQLTRNILLCREGGGSVEHCLSDYVDQHSEQLEKLRGLVNDIKSARQPPLAAIVVVMRELGRLTGR